MLVAAAEALAIAVAGMGTDHDAPRGGRASVCRITSTTAGVGVAADARRGHQLEQRPVVGKPFAQVGVQVDDPGSGRGSPLLEPFMAPALEFRGGDRLEPDSIAGPDREVTVFGIGDAKRCCPQQVPAAGRLDGIDGRLPAGDGDRARRHPQPRRIPTRQAGQSRGEIAGVRKPGQEADREYVVLDLAMQRDHLGRLRANLAATSSRSAPS